MRVFAYSFLLLVFHSGQSFSDSSCPPELIDACRLARQYEAQYVGKEAIRIGMTSRLKQVKAENEALRLTIVTGELYEPFLWMVNHANLTLDGWRSTASAQIIQSICSDPPAQRSARELIERKGRLVYEYYSLDGIKLSAHTLSSCTQKSIADDAFPTQDDVNKKRRSHEIDKWMNATNLFILVAGEAECSHSEWGTPSAPWGNKFGGKEVRSIAPDGKWIARSALHKDGTVSTIFHFKSMKECRKFIDGNVSSPFDGEFSSRPHGSR